MELCMFCDELFGEFCEPNDYCFHDTMASSSPSYCTYKDREMAKILGCFVSSSWSER